MNADKRSVSTDALETLGMVHFREEKRDAIHLAVMPVEAGETLPPGAHIGVSKDGRAYAVAREHCIGIVDPFLTEPVSYRDRFWLVIYPRKIQSLRHVWSHPALPDEVPAVAPAPDETAKGAAERWLRVHAETLGLSYGALLEYAEQWLESGDYVVQLGRETWRDNFDAAGFWPRYELVSGKHVPEHQKEQFFSCSC
jgi:hypothetical protein